MPDKDKDWGDRFIEKLKEISYEDENYENVHALWPDCTFALSYWETLFGAKDRVHYENAGAALDAVAASFAFQAACDARGVYGEVRKNCESPIERAFFDALMIAMPSYKFTPLFMASYLNEVVSLGVDEIKAFFLAQKRGTVFIDPQYEVGKFRVDFNLVSAPRKLEDGKLGWGGRMVIECDGHDFHERTKEQAKRDRSRDRALTREGYRVLRFTGSEIWANPFDCANEALEIFNSMLRDAARPR